MEPACLLTHPGAAASDLPRAERTPTQRYEAVRGQSMALAAPLSPEDCQAQSMPDCSPVKWHLAHTTWFFETFVIGRFEPGRAPFHPQYRMLFNSYYNAIGDKHPRPQRGLLTRPPLADVLRYREHVDATMHTLLARHGGDPEFDALLTLGLNHEQQHQELILTDLKHLLSCNPLRPAYRETAPAGSLPPGTPAGWTRYNGGIVRLGHEGAGFAFDNESPAHDALLRPYCLANRLVTQGEYLEFMLDGGYRRPEFWLSLGWDMVNSAGWRAPMYWEGQKRDWQSFTLHGMQPIDPHAPVTHVSYFEADAYARWARARLPREGEWEHAARLRDAAMAGTGGALAEGRANLLESGHLQPRAAAAPDGAGPSQMYGDVWEWTSSSYDAYPGFAPPEGAVGEYNGKFMCNQYVLRGGSCVTPRDHIRASYRNFFPADARWQFSGIRLALDAT